MILGENTIEDQDLADKQRPQWMSGYDRSSFRQNSYPLL